MHSLINQKKEKKSSYVKKLILGLEFVSNVWSPEGKTDHFGFLMFSQINLFLQLSLKIEQIDKWSIFH